MDSRDQRSPRELDLRPVPPVPSERRSSKGCVWRAIFSGIIFLLGIVIGVLGLLLYAQLFESNRQALVTAPAPQGSDIVVQVSPAFITQIVGRKLSSSGLPGNVKNVQVTLARGEQLSINGDDEFSVLGFGVTRHFTIVVQPFVDACQIKVHVLHADLNGIAVTGFMAAFENQINQQLQTKPEGLPPGFTYCQTSVRTDPQGLFITFSATPL